MRGERVVPIEAPGKLTGRHVGAETIVRDEYLLPEGDVKPLSVSAAQISLQREDHFVVDPRV